MIGHNDNRLLILGAGGYLGTRLCKYFSELGLDVIAFDLCYPSNWCSVIGENIAHIQGDISLEEDRDKLHGLNPLNVINLISLNHKTSEISFKRAFEINVLSTFDFLNGINSSKIRKYINFSSVQVYGRLKESEVYETDVCVPINNYGLTHKMREEVCSLFNTRLDTEIVSLRLSNSYGYPLIRNKECWSLVINELCLMAIKKGEIRLKSNGSPLRDFIHGDDVCKAVHKLIDTKNGQGIYNLASGKAYSIASLARMVQLKYKELFGKLIPVYLNDGSVLEAFAENINGSNKSFNKHAISSIGFEAEIGLDKGIGDLLIRLNSEHV